MKRITRQVSACLLITTGLLVSSCVMDPNEEFIQGSWYYLDPHLEEIISESSMKSVKCNARVDGEKDKGKQV